MLNQQLEHGCTPQHRVPRTQHPSQNKEDVKCSAEDTRGRKTRVYVAKTSSNFGSVPPP